MHACTVRARFIARLLPLLLHCVIASVFLVNDIASCNRDRKSLNPGSLPNLLCRSLPNFFHSFLSFSLSFFFLFLHSSEIWVSRDLLPSFWYKFIREGKFSNGSRSVIRRFFFFMFTFIEYFMTSVRNRLVLCFQKWILRRSRHVFADFSFFFFCNLYTFESWIGSILVFLVSFSIIRTTPCLSIVTNEFQKFFLVPDSRYRENNFPPLILLKFRFEFSKNPTWENLFKPAQTRSIIGWPALKLEKYRSHLSTSFHQIRKF